MPSRASAARYAKALFDGAPTESDPVQIEGELAAFAALMSANTELQAALTNPAVPASGKRRIAEALGARLNASPPVRKLLVLLADRDRLGIVADLLALYRERLMEHPPGVRAEVT